MANLRDQPKNLREIGVFSGKFPADRGIWPIGDEMRLFEAENLEKFVRFIKDLPDDASVEFNWYNGQYKSTSQWPIAVLKLLIEVECKQKSE